MTDPQTIAAGMTRAEARAGYDEAKAAIWAGAAKPKALWVQVGRQDQRDGYALRPNPWEGPGEYQHVAFDDDYCRLIRLPDGARPLKSFVRTHLEKEPKT